MRARARNLHSNLHGHWVSSKHAHNHMGPSSVLHVRVEVFILHHVPPLHIDKLIWHLVIEKANGQSDKWAKCQMGGGANGKSGKWAKWFVGEVANG